MHLNKDTEVFEAETNCILWKTSVFDPSVDCSLLKKHTIDTVYVTHGHCDHFRNGNALREGGAKIIASRKEAFFIESPLVHVRAMFGWANLPPEMVTRFFKGEPCLVDVFLEDIHQSPVVPIPLPGHSIDHHGFMLPNGILLSGDALWPIDLWERTPLPYAIDIDQVRASLKAIKKMEFQWLVPGHGPVLSRDDAEKSIDHHLSRIELLETMFLDILRTPMNVEDAAEALSSKLGLIDRLNRYWLTIVVVKAFLCSLNERKLAAYSYDNYKVVWQTI